MTEPQCTLCKRPRRADRPLCNRCIRRTGEQVLDRYFERASAARRKPLDGVARQQLQEVVDQMIHNATEFGHIKDTGHRPHWNAASESWEHPLTRVRAILDRYYRTHRFYLDATNDATILDNVAVEICPPVTASTHVKPPAGDVERERWYGATDHDDMDN